MVTQLHEKQGTRVGTCWLEKKKQQQRQKNLACRNAEKRIGRCKFNDGWRLASGDLNDPTALHLFPSFPHGGPICGCFVQLHAINHHQCSITEAPTLFPPNPSSFPSRSFLRRLFRLFINLPYRDGRHDNTILEDFLVVFHRPIKKLEGKKMKSNKFISRRWARCWSNCREVNGNLRLVGCFDKKHKNDLL